MATYFLFLGEQVKSIPTSTDPVKVKDAVSVLVLTR